MPKPLSSDLLGNLGRVYKSYGGLASIIRSEYLLLAVLVSASAWRRMGDDSWPSIAWSVLPNLTGFSIAAYALLFSVLDSDQRKALRQPSPRLAGRAPLLVLASSITHAILVQISAILFAFVYDSKPLPHNSAAPAANLFANYLFSALGIFLFAYAVILVLASVLSIFRLLILVPPDTGKKDEASSK